MPYKNSFDTCCMFVHQKCSTILDTGNPRRFCLYLICISLIFIAWLLYIVSAAFPDPHGTDIFTLRVAAESILKDVSPYSQELSDYLMSVWEPAINLRAPPIVAYPLPAIFFFVPLALLPLSIFSAAWFCLLIVALSYSIWVTRRHLGDVLLPLAFYPFIWALYLKTSSVMWFSVLFFVLFAPSIRAPWLRGLALAFLPLKPQMGLLFLPIAVYKAYKQKSSTLVWAVAWGISLLGTSFLLIPDWMAQWYGVVQIYLNEVPKTTVLIPCLILALFCIGLPITSIIAIISLGVFPVNDVYCTMLILLFWRAFKTPIAVIGCAVSWLPSLLAINFNSPYAIISFVLLPALVAAMLFQLTRIQRYRQLRSLLLSENYGAGGGT